MTPDPRAPDRPTLRYHGGKWKLAPWIIGFFPPHETYLEPFGGAASVLMRKPRVGAEIYNDLDDEVVNIFRVLRDPAMAAELRRVVELTPFARGELGDAYLPAGDAIDAARRMLVRSFMGFGSASMTRMHITGFRSSSSRSHGRVGSTPAIDWANWPQRIDAITARLRGVVIENRDACALIRQHDGADTLIYADPPYVQATRSSLKNKNGNRGHYYRHDMTDEQHRAVAETLRAACSMVVISGYPCDLYDELYHGWVRHEKRHMADGARPRTEVVWLNPACSAALAESTAQQRLIA